MKALELADAYADACFDQALNGRTEDPIPEQKRDELAAELRRLAAVESDCAPYLKEGETPAERIKRALGDADSLMSLYRDVVAERDALKAERDELRATEAAWRKLNDTLTHQVLCCGVAASHPDATLTTRGAYAGKWNSRQAEAVRALRADRDSLRAELERIRAMEPVALDHIACICDGELRYMSGRCAPVHDCELYAMPDGKAAPALYALGSKTHE